jgi:hypothetical protein|tara:strand:+ start:211 stop:570 length:360 start_codon:yes stop_codon:yes gene_type:complete
MKEKSGIALIIGVGGGCGCKRKGCPVCEGEKMETSFTAPEGFDFEGMDEGEEKEVLAKVKHLGGGNFSVVSVDGYDLGEEPEMEEEEEEGEEMEGEEMEGEEGEDESYAKQLSARAGLM